MSRKFKENCPAAHERDLFAEHKVDERGHRKFFKIGMCLNWCYRHVPVHNKVGITHMHTRSHTYTHKHTRTQHARTQACMHTHTHARTHTHTHIQTHTHTHSPS